MNINNLYFQYSQLVSFVVFCTLLFLLGQVYGVEKGFDAGLGIPAQEKIYFGGGPTLFEIISQEYIIIGILIVLFYFASRPKLDVVKYVLSYSALFIIIYRFYTLFAYRQDVSNNRQETGPFPFQAWLEWGYTVEMICLVLVISLLIVNVLQGFAVGLQKSPPNPKMS